MTEKGSVFRVFAPAALKVSVIGDFNNWAETEIIKRMELLFASDNELYGGNVQYKSKEIYTAKANVFIIPIGGFTAKYFVVTGGGYMIQS